ncbi:MAG TPA: DHHA1 domain-containing protein [Vicinamibacterales bacterium]|nr:DHHA1 domain-containing protein [Vicinamibacterales bacterium]
MTDRLYYNDAYLREFDASVTRVERRDDRTLITLDRTAFYPTSGGQPFDAGTLSGFRVLDVNDEDDGSISHVIEPPANLQGPVLAIDQPIHGTIDWVRRFDHMQQHTGQHVLSAAFDRLAGVRTVSFHLGAASATIDLAREVSPREIEAAEGEANRIVWEDRAVSIRFVSAEEAASLPLRKTPARSGTLRLVDVDAFDLSACGGTHVSRTGAIGIIGVTSSERFKGGQRIEFVCGGRALARFCSLRDTVASAGRLLSAGIDDLPATIERLQAEAKAHKRRVSDLQEELARYRAEALASSAEVVRLEPAAIAAGTATTLVHLVASAIDADANGLKTLATAITRKPGYLVVLLSQGRPALVVVSRSSDVTVNANSVLSSLLARFGGRGGGKADVAQGGGLDGTGDEILAAARIAFRS